MSLFPDQCVDDILKNGRRRFANHSGCRMLHYDATSLMSKNNVPGWGGNRIRASWAGPRIVLIILWFCGKCVREPWDACLRLICHNPLASFSSGWLETRKLACLGTVPWPSFQSWGWRPHDQPKDSKSGLWLFWFCFCFRPQVTVREMAVN